MLIRNKKKPGLVPQKKYDKTKTRRTSFQCNILFVYTTWYKKKFTLTEGYPCLTLPGVHGFTWPSIECHNIANTDRHDRTQ